MNEDDFQQLERIARATARAEERRREWRRREAGIRAQLVGIVSAIEKRGGVPIPMLGEGEPGLEFPVSRVREARVALGASFRFGQADNGRVLVVYHPPLVVDGTAQVARVGEVLGSHEPDELSAQLLDHYVTEFFRRTAAEHWAVVGTSEGARQAWELFSMPPTAERYL
jgi:hypothetical protein